MTNVLVVVHSVTGHTRALADGVIEGARSVEGVSCRLLAAAEVTNDDLLAADAIIVGSPTYFGQMAADVKHMFDASNSIYGRLESKVGAAFTTVGAAGSGHETTNLSIITAMLVSGMVVPGFASGPTPCFGAFSVGMPTERELRSARHMGERVATLAARLSSA
jgi:NAD(P)H dehydrogenase (quinone)